MTHDTMSTTESREPRQPKRRRRWVVVLAATVGAVVVLLGAGYAWLMSGASVAAVGVPDCHEVPTESTMVPSQEPQALAGVCEAIGQLTTAWQDQDAEAYGAVFTENATYTTFAGTYYDGRDDIIRSHAALYDGPLSGTGLADSFLGLRFLTADVAVLTTRGDTYEDDVPDDLTKVQTYTLVQEDDGWKIAAFQNTQRKKLMEQVQFRWMNGTRPDAER